MTHLLHETQESYPHPPGAYWVPRRLGGGAPTPEEAKLLDEAEFAERAKRAQAGRERVWFYRRRQRVDNADRADIADKPQWRLRFSTNGEHARHSA
jgi:hypothetical protein